MKQHINRLITIVNSLNEFKLNDATDKLISTFVDSHDKVLTEGLHADDSHTALRYLWDESDFELRYAAVESLLTAAMDYDEEDLTPLFPNVLKAARGEDYQFESKLFRAIALLLDEADEMIMFSLTMGDHYEGGSSYADGEDAHYRADVLTYGAMCNYRSVIKFAMNRDASYVVQLACIYHVAKFGITHGESVDTIVAWIAKQHNKLVQLMTETEDDSSYMVAHMVKIAIDFALDPEFCPDYFSTDVVKGTWVDGLKATGIPSYGTWDRPRSKSPEVVALEARVAELEKALRDLTDMMK